MPARASVARSVIPLPPRKLLSALGSGAALDGMTGLVILSAGNAYLLRTLDASAALPALALTLQAVTKIAVSPAAGWIADRRRLSSVLPAVPALATAGLALMLTTRSVAGYLAGLAALSAGISIAWVLLRHCVGDTTSEAERGNAATWISLASGGAVASGFGAGTLLAAVEPRMAFALALMVVAVATVLLDRLRRTADASRRDVSLITASLRPTPQRLQSLALGLVASGQFALAGGLLVTFWPFVLRDLEVPAARVLWLLVPAGFIAVGALGAVGRWSLPGRRLAEVTVLYASVAVGCALAFVTHSPWAFAVAMALVVPAIVAGVPLVTAVVIDFSRGRSGPAGALGWLGSAEAAGSLAGSGIMGVVIASTDARGAFLALAVTAGVLAVATTASVRAQRIPLGSPA
ncbi:MAG: MFS transporter [Dehalococcoidia bacterium]|nr:MAG: MFS transporter [Dehalococcoidia bacterium]